MTYRKGKSMGAEITLIVRHNNGKSTEKKWIVNDLKNIENKKRNHIQTNNNAIEVQTTKHIEKNVV